MGQSVRSKLMLVTETPSLQHLSLLFTLSMPTGLTERFGTDPQKIAQWNAFVSRNKLNAESLPKTVKYLSNKLGFLFEV
jgi:hypothetical protein